MRRFFLTIALTLLAFTPVQAKFDIDWNALFKQSTTGGELPERLHIALYREIPLWAGDEYVTEEYFKTEQMARNVEYFFRWITRHNKDKNYDIDVRAFTFQSNCYPTTGTYCKSEIRQLVDLGDFSPDIHHVWTYMGHDHWCGVANLWGSWSVTYAGCGFHTISHEILHNFGLKHAQTYNNKGDMVEYGDQTDVMGKGHHNPGLAAPYMHKLGLLPAKEITKSTQVLLAPLELDKEALYPNEDQIVYFDVEHYNRTYLSIRKKKDTQFKPHKYAEDVLYIHERNGGYSVRVATLLPGDRYRLDNRTIIEYIDYSEESARVNVLMQDGLEPDELTLDLETVGNLTTEHSGIWHNPEFPGQGMILKVKGSKFMLHWFYTEKEKQFWVHGTGRTDTGHGRLYTVNNGYVNNWGKISISAKDNGTLIYQTTSLTGSRLAATLTPLALSNHPSGGAWQVTESDSASEWVDGFVFTVLSTKLNGITKRWVGYWFAEYKGTQYWYLLDGHIKHSDPNIINFQIYTCSDSLLHFYKPAKCRPIYIAELNIPKNKLTIPDNFEFILNQIF
jgi:hypothetical protein